MRAKSYTQAPTVRGDYHLTRVSPCIDAGSFVNAPVTDLDGEVRPRKINFDMGADEFSNSSFEYGTAIPFLWKGQNLGTEDGRVLRIPEVPGSYCFRMTGSNANKSIRQTVGHAGLAGEQFSLSGSSRAEGVPTGGGLYRIYARVYHTDSSHKRYSLDFTGGTHGWEHKELAFTAEKDFNRIVIYVCYAQPAGTAWFDDVTLTSR